MLRVPGSGGDLLLAKARGADVRIVYSPARCRRHRAPRAATAGGVLRRRLRDHRAGQRHGGRTPRRARASSNFSLLVAHVLVPPAVEALLSAPELRDPRPARPGHVCVITGYRDYEADRRALPHSDRGHRLRAARPLARHRCRRAAARARRGARREPVRTCRWRRRQPRGAPTDRRSLRRLRSQMARPRRDPCQRLRAWRRPTPPSMPKRIFVVARLLRVDGAGRLSERSGAAGPAATDRCPHFGQRCTPEHPLGATMVSSEGACAAYFHYGRRPAETEVEP